MSATYCWGRRTQPLPRTSAPSSSRASNGCVRLALRAHAALPVSPQPVLDGHAHNPARAAQVQAWRARGRVPLSVDVTACLIEAQLRDAVAGHASSALVRNLYSLPIIRCVTWVPRCNQAASGITPSVRTPVT